LAQLKEGAMQLGSGDFGHRILLSTSDELGELAFVFNEMAANLHTAQDALSISNAELLQRNQDVEEEKKRSEALLQNILPASIALELRDHGVIDPKFYGDVTIVFTDFKGFTLSTEKLAAEDLVWMLHDYFSTFDEITSRYGLEKLKTIGDSYMYAGGLPTLSPSHPVDCCMAALDILDAVRERVRSDRAVNWQVRVGIHTGSVVAGVVGTTKFAFDVWGDTVNMASRMESSGAPGRVNISEATYRRVKDFLVCEDRGQVKTKEGREQNMYFVNGILPELVDVGSEPPYAKFLARYATYFEKAPSTVPRNFSAPSSLAQGV
jgi:class 3 adenylate cyclase